MCRFFLFCQILIFEVFIKIMIYSLRGIIQELSPTYTVIEVNGVGYYVGISVRTSEKLTAGKETFLYTQQIFREDFTSLKMAPEKNQEWKMLWNGAILF